MNEEAKSKIEELKKEVDTYRPLSKDVEGRIMQKFRLDWNFHSNNIEGNQLTFGETKTFLLHGITADKKPLKDHLDIKGHNEALLYLESIVHKKEPITEVFIRGLHEVILKEPYENPAISPDGKMVKRKINIGEYKSQANHVVTTTGETFYFASPEETPAKMHDLINWQREEEKKQELHPLELAAQFHYSFIRIHPFDDGNGRMARILMNLILMRNGFPPVVVKTQDKDNYFKALQGADGGDVEVFEDYIAENLLDSLELFLRGAKGEDISELADLHKEIALFKKEIENKKNEKVVQKSLGITKELNINFFTPFFYKIINNSVQLKSLFHSAEIIAEGIENGKAVELIMKPTYKRHWSEELSVQIPYRSEMNITYVLKGFKNDKKNIFNVKNIFTFILDEFEYGLKFNHQLIFKKPYYEKVLQEEIDDVIKMYLKHTLELIKKKISKN